MKLRAGVPENSRQRRMRQGECRRAGPGQLQEIAAGDPGSGRRRPLICLFPFHALA